MPKTKIEQAITARFLQARNELLEKGVYAYEMDNPFEFLNQRLTNIENLLLALQKQPVPQQPVQEPILTIKEAAALISLSVPTVYNLVSRKEIPNCKKGNRLYFSQAELMQWVKKGKRSTVEDLANEADTFLATRKLSAR